MLYLIGLGLGNEKDITLNGIEAAKKCECYIETYTSKWSGNLQNLENIIGKNISEVKRKDLEDNQKEFLEKCKKSDIVLFILGDPLAATTHIDLVEAARTARIEVQIIHNSSIFSAIGEFGLQLYKYGKTATVPFSGKLESVKDTVEGNQKLGLHSLLLLDLDAESGIYMTVREALKLLTGAKILNKNTKVICGKIGKEIIYDKISELMERDIETPSVIVIPGKLHFHEKEFLEIL